MLSERIYFIIEGFTDIVNLEMDLDYEVKREILNLLRELYRIHDYLSLFDERDEEPSLSDHRFFMEIDAIADSCDDFLVHIGNEHNWREQRTPHFWFDLVQKVVQSYQAVQLQPTFIFNNGNNVNTGAHAQQITGSTTVNVSNSPTKPSNIKQISRTKSYGHVHNSDIVGFASETKTLIGYLTQIEHCKTRVVSIVGMGGSGKTTLAKHVYHHPDIKTHFDIQVWVCISESWNKRDILCDMLWRSKGTSFNDSKQMSDAKIFEDLSKHLSSLSYLVVLDDIWDMNAWYDISPALPSREGSKVIVTTRKTDISKTIDLTVLNLKPEPLNETESYELFQRIIFLDENPSRMLEKLGGEMVKRCRGLPLAITALAGILRIDKSESRWRRISETLMRKILNTRDLSQGVVKEILEMSYHDLPYYLKPCVLYLGVFPEDYLIEAEELLQMWMGECLTRSPQENEGYKESKGEEYLEEMIQRCIVQDVKVNHIGQVMSFRVHDLIRELCIGIAERKGFFKDSHRISSSFARFLESEKNSHVRSLISLKSSDARFSSVKLDGLFQKFMLLRVLILCPNSLLETIVIPEEIGNLIHLRYLELYGWYNVILPSAFENLQNLWTLNLIGVSQCTMMPNFLRKMKDLEHLYLPQSYEIEGKRHGGVMNLDRLQKLKTLWYAKGGEWMLSEMPKLSPTLEKLKITCIESEEQLKPVFSIPSMLSNNLKTLALNWYDVVKAINLDDMKNLYKCESLRDLKLVGMIYKSRWSRTVVFPPNLVKLELYYTLLRERNVMGMIDKCCPQLKILVLACNAFAGNELICNANSFRELEELKLYGDDDLKRWRIERGAMSNLKILSLLSCVNLELMPQGWEFISKVPQVKYENSFNEESQFEENLRLRRQTVLGYNEEYLLSTR